MIDEPVDVGGKAKVSSSPSAPGRARRLFEGWSANLVQMVLGITQQVALVPVFLHYWTSEALAAWLVVYAAGNLICCRCRPAIPRDQPLSRVQIGRRLRWPNRPFYAAMLRIYFGLVAALSLLLLAGAQLLAALRDARI